MRRLLLLSLSVVFVACAAHEKAGDRAAAVGDWKTAEAQYAEALRRDPRSPEKKAKWEAARAQAIASSFQKAQACAVSQDWECAFAESDYALRLEPASSPVALFRADAARNVGAARVVHAKEAAQRRDFRAAFDLLQRARDVTNDPGVQAQVRAAEPSIVRGAVDEAGRLRQAQQYPQAIELLGLAAGVDGSVRPSLDRVKAEYERWLDAQYEAVAQEGDALVGERRWAEALARYEAALRFRNAGRAVTMARYAQDMRDGELAVQARDFLRAQAAYEDAVRLGVDRGISSDQLERVRIRPVAIRVAAVLVKPIRPDGQPWNGPRGRGFDRVVGMLASAAFDARNDRGLRSVLAVYEALPHENRPNLVVTVDLPDGRRLATAPRQAIRARLASTFVLDTNDYDDRAVTIRVAHQAATGLVEIGAAQVPVAELVQRGAIALADGSILELRLEAEPTRLPDGAFEGFFPVRDATNVADAWSVPGAQSRGFRVVSVDANVQPTDYDNELGADGAPDLFVEIEQRGAIVYRSPVLADRLAASWSPGAVYLFVAPDEQVTVRLWDQDPVGPDQVMAYAVTGRSLESGSLELRTPKGSQLRLRAEPRYDGPGVRGHVARR